MIVVFIRVVRVEVFRLYILDLLINWMGGIKEREELWVILRVI